MPRRDDQGDEDDLPEAWQRRRDRKAQSRQLRVVLSIAGGMLILGGLLGSVLVVGISIGNKRGEVARNEIGKGLEQPKSADPESVRLKKELATLQEELATLRKEQFKIPDPTPILKGSDPVTNKGQWWLGEWTQVAGPGTMHIEFRPDGITKSWISLTKDQLTVQRGSIAVP